MLLQSNQTAASSQRDGIAAQLKLADEAASLSAQKRIKGSNDNRLRKNLLGFVADRG